MPWGFCVRGKCPVQVDAEGTNVKSRAQFWSLSNEGAGKSQETFLEIQERNNDLDQGAIELKMMNVIIFKKYI